MSRLTKDESLQYNEKQTPTSIATMFSDIIGVFAYIAGTIQLYKSLLWYRFTNKSVRVCNYGKHFRNTLDIYLPHDFDKNKKYPVIVMNIGSGWIFGNKFFAMPIAYLLQKMSVVTVAIDYQRYPFTNIDDHIMALSKAINWIFDNIQTYQGDVDNITVIGYSAGAHVLMNAVYNQLSNVHRWKFNGIILWSVPYDLHHIRTQHKLPMRILQRGFNHNFSKYCMTKRLLHMMENKEIKPSDFCPIYMLNGDADVITDFDSATQFYDLLKNNGFQTKIHCATGWGHTHYLVRLKYCEILAQHAKSVSDDHNIKDKYANVQMI